jgi:F-type H+-transporting ATPase subunit gamma
MTEKEIRNQIDNLQAVQNIADVYQEVAAMRMRKVKDGILQNRSFYQKLLEIYLETQGCYKKKMGSDKKYVTEYSKNTNGKAVAVLLSSNTGLYGSVIKNTFNQFVENTGRSNEDIVIAGQLGRNRFEELTKQKPFKYFELADGTDGLDGQIQQIFKYISNYSEIAVYHGIFKSIVDQPVKITKITQEIEQENKEAQSLSFLFEPSVDKVLQVFEEQLMYSFFNQTVYESALSKYGSRMLSLDVATQNVSKMLLQTKLVSTKMKHRSQNKKQLESLKLWNSQ